MLWLILMMLASQVSTELLQERLLCGRLAAQDLLAFARLTLPVSDDPLNPRLSRYDVQPHHRLIAEAMEKVERGEVKRLIIVLPPRHGKTELAVRRFIPWAMGRNPRRSFIVTTYSDRFSADHGRDVRSVMQAPEYRVAFNRKCLLRTDSQAMDRLMTTEGGAAYFVGRGGAITGRGADIFIIDDPIKDTKEAQSPVIREYLWNWFIEVAMTRLLSDDGRVVIIQTRWHEDDLVGRLLDPRNRCYNAHEAAKWQILRLPALAEANDPLGRPEGEALWPALFSTEYLQGLRDMSPQAARSFAKVWQGNPTPEEGTFFKADWLQTYQPEELPKYLRYYCASDHAVSLDQENDATCLVPVGIDERGEIWVLPEVWWRRADTRDVVEAMLNLMRRYKPLTWWAESGHISKSIGPFLRDRMQEEGVFVAIDEVVPVKDKQTRAQSIQGRMSMKKVHFPGFAPWWADALDELMKFPNGAHDDLVDALAHMGMGLDRLVPAEGNRPPKDNRPKPGTMDWVKYSAKQEEWRKRMEKANAGY